MNEGLGGKTVDTGGRLVAYSSIVVGGADKFGISMARSRLRQYHKRLMVSSRRTLVPPTTPPTIAPTGVVFELDGTLVPRLGLGPEDEVGVALADNETTVSVEGNCTAPHGASAPFCEMTDAGTHPATLVLGNWKSAGTVVVVTQLELLPVVTNDVDPSERESWIAISRPAGAPPVAGLLVASTAKTSDELRLSDAVLPTAVAQTVAPVLISQRVSLTTCPLRYSVK